MMCVKPIWIGKKTQSAVACGQCMHCRINHRRKWATRMMLESTDHLTSSFVTLTYSPENIPLELLNDAPTEVLRPRDMTLWLKRFRNEYGKYRYFAVGEYGTKSQRPHYHAILFGVDPGQNEKLIAETWGLGFTQTYPANEKRMMYVAQYTIKKWNNRKAKDLHLRPPEFSRMSRKPAIGAGSVKAISSSYFTRSGAKALSVAGLAHTVRIEGKQWPLDRTMKSKILLELGVPSNVKVLNTIPDGDIDKARAQEKKLKRHYNKNHGSL